MNRGERFEVCGKAAARKGTMTRAIDIQMAEKTYGGFRSKVKALRDVKLQVERGEIAGLIGPNGAGKSTLVKILMTVIRASKVEGTLLGQAIGDKGTLMRVGYLPEHHKFPDYLTAERVLQLFGAMAGVDRRQRRERIPKLLDMVGLSEVGKKTVKQFSKGMRQRLGLAQAMINEPDLLLLDEPTDGVDPEGRRDIREILLELKRQGKSILVNSHILTELAMMIDQAIVIHRGRVLTSGRIDELTGYDDAIEIVVKKAGSDGGVERLMEGIRSSAIVIASGKSQSMSMREAGAREMYTLRVERAEPSSVQGLIDVLRQQGHEIHSMTRTKPTLEQAFLKHINRAEESERLASATGPVVRGAASSAMGGAA
jgi:ABC-2 type transport system ATP-binding protein